MIGHERAEAATTRPRHFLDLGDVPAATLRAILDDATARKRHLKAKDTAHAETRPLAGRTLAMIFERPSTRTRVSFDVGMRQLGGETIVLSGAELQIGRGETIADTARVLSRYVDAIMIRILSHEALLELADHATVPVVNGLTQRSHPCQVMADVMTYEEHRGPIAGAKVAWIGDGNNVLSSFVHAADRFGFSLRAATPLERPPLAEAQAFADRSKADIRFSSDAEEAAAGADLVVTDVWVSMGDDDKAARHNIMRPYQVNGRLMARASQDALFMHCLPAHRGEEVTEDVIDGPQSAVFDEAENRLHVQKGILAWCLGAGPPEESPQ